MKNKKINTMFQTVDAHLLWNKTATGLNISKILNFEPKLPFFSSSLSHTQTKHLSHRNSELLCNSSLMCWTTPQCYSLLFGCTVQKRIESIVPRFNRFRCTLHNQLNRRRTHWTRLHSTTRASMKSRGQNQRESEEKREKTAELLHTLL